MQYPRPQVLIPGRLIKRYKRFLADIALPDGTALTVHCPNSGAMTSCSAPASPVLLSDSGNPTRKLRYTWEMIRVADTWVGVNTTMPNVAVAHFVAQGWVPELQGYTQLRREVRYGSAGKSRIDLLLQSETHAPCYVEIKNCTLRVGEHAAFPDAITSRGQKHVRELCERAAHGERAVMFFFVGRSDCSRWRPADEVDPVYGRLLREATRQGVELLAYRMRFCPSAITLAERLPIDL